MEYGKTNILNKVFTKNTLHKWISLEKSDIYAINSLIDFRLSL